LALSKKRIAVRAALVVALFLAAYFAFRTRSLRVESLCASSRPEALRVLFVGNSHTAMNGLGKMFCKLGNKTRPMRVTQVVRNGWSLRDHLKDGHAVRVIREQGPWDWVVIQEQSVVTTSDRQQYLESARAFSTAIHDAHAKPAIYALWPRLDIHQTDAAVTAAHEAAAREIGARLVPVGRAWKLAAERHADIPLYKSDQYHANKQGSYLGALVFYASLLEQTPEGLPAFAGLSRAQADDFQRIAWQAAKSP
jgi:hypothetical protein